MPLSEPPTLRSNTTEQQFLELAEASKEKYEEQQKVIAGLQKSLGIARKSLCEAHGVCKLLGQAIDDIEGEEIQTVQHLSEMIRANMARALEKCVLHSGVDLGQDCGLGVLHTVHRSIDSVIMTVVIV